MSFRNITTIAALALLFFLSFIHGSHASSFEISDRNCAQYKFDPSSFPDKDFDYLLTDHYTLWRPSKNESDHKANCLKYYWVSESKKVLDWATAGCNLEPTQPIEFLRFGKKIPVRITESAKEVFDRIRKETEEENRLLYSLKDMYYKEEEEKKSGKEAEHELHCFMNITSSALYNRRRPDISRYRSLLY